MSAPIQPWTFLVVTVAGWIQREQQLAIDYSLEENRVLKVRLCGSAKASCITRAGADGPAAVCFIGEKKPSMLEFPSPGRSSVQSIS